MNTTNGRIAEQSKQAFINALLTIMKQYDYREITITQIAQEAQLSRKTFYRLFSDKDAIIILLFENLLNNLMTQIRENDIHHYWEVVQIYFDFWEAQGQLLSLIKRNGLLTLLSECMYQHSQEVFKCVRSNEIAHVFSRELPYLLAYAVGGMQSMLLKWIEDDMQIPSSEIITKLKAGFMSIDI
ncbi:MAG: TetR/AcrR family transcriptional regulator [bacterium]|nr:TetR/AcrR family transcriptional regulator [bacterium]